MKNKKTLYILIPLVALVWSLIIWKVLSFQPVGQKETTFQKSETRDVRADTSRYELKVDYQDPFLRSGRTTHVSQPKEGKRRNNNIKTADIKNINSLSKPSGVVYRGVIAGNEERVGLLEIEGHKKLIKENSEVDGYKILSIEENLLRISYLEKEYVYEKQ